MPDLNYLKYRLGALYLAGKLSKREVNKIIDRYIQDQQQQS